MSSDLLQSQGEKSAKKSRKKSGKKSRKKSRKKSGKKLKGEKKVETVIIHLPSTYGGPVRFTECGYDLEHPAFKNCEKLEYSY